MTSQPGHPTESVDAIVIGAGPGGSVTATRLARLGRSVLLLERRELPRFHIGESLLPSCMVTLRQLGVLDRVLGQGYVDKFGAEFSFDFGFHLRFPFKDQGPGRYPQAIQVERAHFDQTLALCARDAGATFLEGANVTELLVERDRVVGVEYEHGGQSHTVRASYVIDAGGRASKIARRFGLRRSIDRIRMVAVFRHFKGLVEANNPGVTGDIQVGAHLDGWVWAIPIWADTISIGAVMPRAMLQGRDPEQVLTQHVSRLLRIKQRIAGCEPAGPVKIETDYCYYADIIAGPGWLMVGDAACFLDPIFSGGATIAMATGKHAADTVDRMISAPDSEIDLSSEYGNFLKTGYDTYARLIYSHYKHKYNIMPALAELGVELHDGNLDENKALIRLMCGDFWSQDNMVGELLRKHSDFDTFAPFPRVHQCPFYGAGA
jgi:FADH2-dependent halogenase